VTPRTLRDNPSAPRRVDGSYDGPELLAWAARRVPPVALSETEIEKSLNLAELGFERLLDADADGAIAVAAADFLGGLLARHGEAGLLAFAGEQVRLWARLAGTYRAAAAARRNQTAEQRRKEIEARVKAEIEAEESIDRRSRLDLVAECDACHRIRHGSEWRREAAPTDREKLMTTCPNCWPRE
jgi:hypothetical protein